MAEVIATKALTTAVAAKDIGFMAKIGPHLIVMSNETIRLVVGSGFAGGFAAALVLFVLAFGVVAYHFKDEIKDLVKSLIKVYLKEHME